MQTKKEERIFIKNLPETATSKDLQTIFSKYGDVVIVDIKERKNDNTTSISKFFAYVTVKTDDRSLQKCFNYFANNLWHGQNIELQIAKQNFLDRLRKEREESCKVIEKNDEVKSPLKSSYKDVKINYTEEVLINTCKKQMNNETTTESSGKRSVNARKLIAETSNNLLETELDNETLDNSKVQNKKNVDLPQSELKRVQSVNQMVREYRQQKLAIKAALSNVDFKPNNKIIFEEGVESLEETNSKSESSTVQNGRKQLFENEDDSECDYNFEVETRFKGKKGQELLELQSKYKNDKRFVLNERFIQDDDENNASETKNLEEIPMEEEKQQQFEILEQVLGNRLKSKPLNNEKSCTPKGGMLRFDPTQSEHFQYEIKNTESVGKNKRKRKNSENPADEVEIPESKVSKQIFYKVSDDLKGTLQNDGKFSLLNLFGQREQSENHQQDEEQERIIKSVNISSEINPFRYDSSDDDAEEIPLEAEGTSDRNDKEAQSSGSKFWTESFFFKNDDYRLQEGLDFLKRIASEKKDEFIELRKNLKDIVKAKVRNNHRKNKPFKKKLGGSKKKKIIRIKKAMKR